MSGSLPNVATVSALPGHRLAVRWRDGAQDVVDFRVVLTSHPAFAPLWDKAAFAEVHVMDWGGGIDWGSGVDYAADALQALALQQREVAASPRSERLEDLLGGYDAAKVSGKLGAWLSDVPKGKEIL